MTLRFILIATLLSAGVSLVISQGVEPENRVDPIGFVGHGVIYGPDARPVQATARWVRQAQDHYLARLQRDASPVRRAELASKLHYVRDLGLDDGNSELLARNLVLEWAVERFQPVDAEALKLKSRVLHRWLWENQPPREAAAPGRLPESLAARLAPIGIVPQLAAAPFEVVQAREAYMKKCAAAGVPVPPGWDQGGAKKWASKGTLEDPFIELPLSAGLYVYQSAKPLGVCLALTRFTDNPGNPNFGFYPLLGVICMGADPKPDDDGSARVGACFWDAPAKLKIGDALPLSEFLSGPEFDGSKGICTDCHGGENAFFVHPDDPAFKNIDNLRPKAWYRPIGLPDKPTWPLNDVPKVDILANEASKASCNAGGCHLRNAKGGAFPKLSTLMPGYCELIDTAYAMTMPPTSTGAPAGDPDYLNHVTALKAACKKAP